MKFYDLDIQSNLSNGENSIEEIIDFSKKLGFSGIAICDEFKDLETLKKLTDSIKNLKTDLEVYPGVKIKAKNPTELKEIVNKVREKVLIVIVNGGNYMINRTACENPKVDILSHPELERIDSGLDEACLKAAHKNNVAVQINFREILHSYRRPRSHITSKMATNIYLCDKYNAPLVICSGAQSIWDMRDPRELISIVNVLGLELGKSFSAITSTPQKLIEMNKKKLEGKIVTEGVEVVE